MLQEKAPVNDVELSLEDSECSCGRGGKKGGGEEEREGGRKGGRKGGGEEERKEGSWKIPFKFVKNRINI